MSSDIKSISLGEAEGVQEMILNESEKAKTAVRKVMNSPNLLTHWQ